ncbi:MAG: sulfite exporter TauE/SafE family protein [Gammaproteobacteria bacterium]|nr:sulfite exporter TauE/SafE family protein [Gammaproteobacteria bacterium]
MDSVSTFSAAFLVGLLGSSHCVAMCGGIVGMLSLSLPEPARHGLRLWGHVLNYNLGRILSYALAGALVASIGRGFALGADSEAVNKGIRLVSAAFLVLMGLYVSRWWPVLTRVETLGAGLWRRISPLSKRLLPLDRGYKSLAAGLLWGWLPCGLTYSALAWTVSAGSAVQGAWLMLGFGLGTLPAMLLTGAGAQRMQTLTRKPWLRQLAGLVLIFFGLWTGAQVFASHRHSAATEPSHEHHHSH